MRRRATACVLATLFPSAAFAQVTGAAPAPADQTVLPQVNVIAPTPLLGSGMDRNTVPAQNQVLTSHDLSLQGPPNYLGALQSQA